MKYCKLCVQPDTRPGVQFDAEGVCLACRFAEQNDKVDWDARRKELEEIAEYGRKNNLFGYDCVIGVSGGKDSTRQALYVRDELGLNPLLVCNSYPPEQLADRGAHNLSNLIEMGFDCIISAPDPKIWKRLQWEGFEKHGNWCRATEMALYASAPKIAIAYHIPLIFLGENPAISLGSVDVGSTTGDANKMKYANTLGGGDPRANNLVPKDILDREIIPYVFPSDQEMEWAKLKLVYLGYYIKDFTRFKNAEFAIERGLQIRTEPSEETGNLYNFGALDEDFFVPHQMMKYLKYGFGQVVDEVCEAVRLGMMTREKAIEYVKKYDGKCAPRYIQQLCRYFGITEEKFWEIAESYRNKNIWEKDATGNWKLKVELVP